MALAGGLLLGVCASSDVANTPSTTATTSQATTESVSTSATTGSTTSGTILGTEVAADAFLATLSEEQRERVAYAPATRRKHVLVELAG